MSFANTVIKVALPVPLRRGFDYLCPPETDASKLSPGMRVAVPFGNRKLVGIIIAVGDSTNLASQKLKQASEILDNRPLVPEVLLRLIHWCASYYHHPIGDVFATASDLPRTTAIQPQGSYVGRARVAHGGVGVSLPDSPRRARIPHGVPSGTMSLPDSPRKARVVVRPAFR